MGRTLSVAVKHTWAAAEPARTEMWRGTSTLSVTVWIVVCANSTRTFTKLGTVSCTM